MTGFTKALGSIRQWLVIMTDRQPMGYVCGNPKSMIFDPRGHVADMTDGSVTCAYYGNDGWETETEPEHH